MTILRMIILLIICTIFLSCATATKTYSPSGNVGFNIDCSGSALNWGHCYTKAGEICGSRGYVIISKSGDKGVSMGAGKTWLYGGTIITRSMIIECKN